MLNQARRSSSLSQPPPSSPPSVLHYNSEINRSPEARGVPSPAQTLWTAHPSPTQTLGYSSPELPPLASLAGLQSFSGSPSTAADYERIENTSYYTASWGSPYRRPPPSSRGRDRLRHLDDSDDFDEDASNLQFGLEHLLPRPLEEDDSPGRFNLEHLLPQRLEQDASPTQFNLEHLIPSRLSNLETPTRGHFNPDLTPRSTAHNPHNPTEEWVKQFLDGRWNRETGDWLSEGSAESELGSDSSKYLKPVDRGARNSHKSRRSNKTLNQQDFWSHFSKGQREELGKMMASRYAPEAPSRQASNGSLRSAFQRSVQGDGPPTAPNDADASGSSKPVDATPTKPRTPVEPVLTPRPRKKVMVKGKACVISIPRDIPRGTPGYPPKPMSPAAVEQKLQEFQRAAFDVHGDAVRGAIAQNRAIWPDEADVQADRASQWKVRVPNRAEWEAYVQGLMEAKLAALGVSLGGEEEEPQMSRQASSQHPGLPFSPALPTPTNSAGSHRVRQGSIVSGSFPLGPSPGHASRQSMASPMTIFPNPRMHMHRHSTFSPASFVQQTNSPTGTWSPGGYFGSQGTRGGSPALPLSRPDLAEVISPVSPFGMRPNQQFPHTPIQKDDMMIQMQQQQQQQQLQAQVMLQQQQQLLGLRPPSTLAEVPEDEAEEGEVAALNHATQPGPDIAVPTPRGHRSNISANLEREARDAEYHLEQAIDKQFDEGGDFSTEPEITPEHLKPSNPVTNSTWEGSRPVLHQPQPHNRAHSLAQAAQSTPFGYGSQQRENPRGDSDGAKTNISDVTNPSLEGDRREATNDSVQHGKGTSQVSNSWKDSSFAPGKSGSAMHSKHTSRSSISKLNVEAKEFKFNPSASFSPATMSSGFSLPPTIKPGGFYPAPPSHLDSLASLNVSAPVFKPDAPEFQPKATEFKPKAPTFRPDVPAFTPILAGGSGMPTSGFNFLSSGPSFKPEAPAFNPGTVEFRPSVQSPAPTTISSKIFGDINISASDIIKPAKRSKAIPIVRPDHTQQTPEKSQEAEGKEDESGRITQADGREKRVRRGPGGSNDVPKFAIQPILPSQQPLRESKKPQSAQQAPTTELEVLPEDKENVLPNAERAMSKEQTPEPLVLKEYAPPAEADVATPLTEKSTEILSSTQSPIDDKTPHESDANESDPNTPTVEEAPKSFATKHGHKSSLSATAKPFEFRPLSAPRTDFGIHVTRPSVAEDDDFDRTIIPPLRQASRSPATTFGHSDAGSYKTAVESRRHMPYPESESLDFDQLGQASFNDIDAVMKHMDEEGSDFGVEREGPAWERSSTRLSPHNLERSDLQPNTNLRSDAPSPSPRRLYAPHNMVGSSTSLTQDPFDDERAGIAYESPVHRLNNADEVPVSDWDEDILSEGEGGVQTRSRFFDSHVDSLLSRLLQSRLGPLESNLQGIQDSLAMITQRNRRGRRSVSTNDRVDSDADDEDDESVSHYRNRSPRKDRKLEKIRSIIKEVLESHQQATTTLSVPVSESDLPAKIREAVVDALATSQPSIGPAEKSQSETVRDIIMEALAHHQPQWTPPKFEPVPADQIRAIVEEAIQSHQPAVPAPIIETVKPDEIRSIVAEVVAANAPQPPAAPVEPIQPDDIRAIVMEAFATHAPQPAIEPIQPDAIRSIVAEALSSHQQQNPTISVTEPVEPDTIRSIVEQALASHKLPVLEAPIDIPQPQVDLSEIYQVIGSLKASIAQTTSNHLQVEDVRELLDDAFKRQSMEVAKREESQVILEKDARIAHLEGLLKESSVQLEGEFEARKVLEAREIDRERLIKVTEEELNLLREAASDDENKIRALKNECEVAHRNLDTLSASENELRSRVVALQDENEELKLKAIAFETSEEDIKKRLDAVTAENEALTFTLNEHRISADKWRNEIQHANEERERLRKAIEQSRFQAEEAARVRESMRVKFEKIQQDLAVASGQAAAERAQWQKNDETHMKKYEVLSARIEAEGRTRERLERELERLETQEREAMKLRITLEQVQKHNSRLEETIDQLKHENLEHRRAAEKFERDYREARETGHIEVRRTRVLMQADIEAANHQVNIIRADLEAEVSRVRAELDNVRMDADTLKAKHELELEAASDAKKSAVEQALQSNKTALQEQQQAFERRLELVSQEHARALALSREDKDRAEAYSKDRLSVADSKMEILQEKISLLEEKLAIAKEAANAAAAAAQSAKSPTAAEPSSYASGAAEKISPQALRESIAVLQEQLQERESRIESLEQQLAEVDTDAPNKLKERDTEIGWLRELLGVRIDDLNDLINALAQPSFNRETVRDAAIRIRTNLQMEQSEKERLITGGQSFPTLSTLSNFASPKAVQLAAAFGNWRKGRENASSNLAGSSGNSSRNQTPSRIAPPSAQSFLSGLMTPPTSNARRGSELKSSAARPQALRSHSASSRGSDAGFPSLGKQPVPSTPPLLRRAAYDQDAEDGHFSESGFYDDESTVDGETTPIGLNFGNELRREE